MNTAALKESLEKATSAKSLANQATLTALQTCVENSTRSLRESVSSFQNAMIDQSRLINQTVAEQITTSTLHSRRMMKVSLTILGVSLLASGLAAGWSYHQRSQLAATTLELTRAELRLAATKAEQETASLTLSKQRVQLKIQAWPQSDGQSVWIAVEADQTPRAWNGHLIVKASLSN